MTPNLNPVKTLLGDMAQDDYVRFKYGKRVDAALKLLAQVGGGPDAAELEARLLEVLDLVRGGKGGRGKKGAGAAAPEAKRVRPARPAAAGSPPGAP